MEYMIGNTRVKVTSWVYEGNANNVYMAKKNGDVGEECLLLEVKDKKISEGFAEIISGKNSCFSDSFGIGGKYYVTAPFREARNIFNFIYSEEAGIDSVINICRNILVKIQEINLPYPILFIILKKGKINIDRNRDIYFTYDLDLSLLDKDMGEKSCAKEYGYIVEKLLDRSEYEEYAITTIIRGKNKRGGYISFQDISCDLENKELIKIKKVFFGRIKGFVTRNKNSIVKLIVILSIIFIGAAAVIMVSEMAFETGRFDVIGTENLEE